MNGYSEEHTVCEMCDKPATVRMYGCNHQFCFVCVKDLRQSDTTRGSGLQLCCSGCLTTLKTRLSNPNHHSTYRNKNRDTRKVVGDTKKIVGDAGKIVEVLIEYAESGSPLSVKTCLVGYGATPAQLLTSNDDSGLEHSDDSSVEGVEDLAETDKRWAAAIEKEQAKDDELANRYHDELVAYFSGEEAKFVSIYNQLSLTPVNDCEKSLTSTAETSQLDGSVVGDQRAPNTPDDLGEDDESGVAQTRSSTANDMHEDIGKGDGGVAQGKAVHGQHHSAEPAGESHPAGHQDDECFDNISVQNVDQSTSYGDGPSQQEYDASLYYTVNNQQAFQFVNTTNGAQMPPQEQFSHESEMFTMPSAGMAPEINGHEGYESRGNITGDRCGRENQIRHPLSVVAQNS